MSIQISLKKLWWAGEKKDEESRVKKPLWNQKFIANLTLFDSKTVIMRRLLLLYILKGKMGFIVSYKERFLL